MLGLLNGGCDKWTGRLSGFEIALQDVDDTTFSDGKGTVKFQM